MPFLDVLRSPEVRLDWARLLPCGSSVPLRIAVRPCWKQRGERQFELLLGARAHFGKSL